MRFARIGRRGQIALPKEVWMKINVAEGDLVSFIVDGDQILIVPVAHTMVNMRGRVKTRGRQDFDVIRRKVKEKRTPKTASKGRSKRSIR